MIIPARGKLNVYFYPRSGPRFLEARPRIGRPLVWLCWIASDWLSINFTNCMPLNSGHSAFDNCTELSWGSDCPILYLHAFFQSPWYVIQFSVHDCILNSFVGCGLDFAFLLQSAFVDVFSMTTWPCRSFYIAWLKSSRPSCFHLSLNNTSHKSFLIGSHFYLIFILEFHWIVAQSIWYHGVSNTVVSTIATFAFCYGNEHWRFWSHQLYVGPLCPTW